MRYAVFILLALGAACAPAPTKVWLSEYENLLKDTVKAVESDPAGFEAEQMRFRLSQKEAQINDLLRDASTQEQMNFLSEYYDMRVRFFYHIQ